MDEIGAQLRFLLPGLTHSLGNALFTIQGRAQLLGTLDSELGRDRRALLSASEKARHALEFLGMLQGDPAPGVPPQTGVLLQRLSEYLRIPLRAHGLQLHIDHSSSDSPVYVDARALSLAVVELVRHLVAALPAGFEGDLHLDLIEQREDQVALALRLCHAPSRLPFPVALGDVVQAARPLLNRLSVCAGTASEQRELLVAVPTRQLA